MKPATGLAWVKRELTKVWLEWRLLAGAVGLVIGLGLVLAVGGGAYASWMQGDREGRLGAIGESYQHWVGAALRETFAQVEQNLQSNILASKVSVGGPEALTDDLSRLVETTESVIGARFVSPGQSTVELTSNPALGYAALDMVRRTEAGGSSVVPEVLFFGSDNQQVAMLKPLRDGDSLVGHVLLAINVSVLADAARSANAAPDEVFLELQQRVATGRPLVLATAGNADLRQGLAALTLPLKSTAWRLQLWRPGVGQAQPTLLAEYQWAVFAIVAVVLLGGVGAQTFLKRRRAIAKPVYEGAVASVPVDGGAAGDDLLARFDTPAAAVGAMPPPLPVIIDNGPETGLIILEEHEDGLAEGSPEGLVAEPGTPPPAPVDDALDTAQPPPSSAAIPVGMTSAPPAAVFRAYDIRGIINEAFGPAHFKTLGQAIGSEAYDRGQQTVVVARDGRLSSPELHQSVIAGLRESGRDVIDIGLVPTPLLYFATYYLNTGSGVMVTASHNPRDYNGLKVMLGGETLFDQDIAALSARIEAGNFQVGEGNLQEMDLLSEYIRRVSEDIPVALGNAFRLVLDCGNGVAGTVAPKLFRALGHDVVELYCDVDGSFPNHEPDTSDPANLQDLAAAVAEHGADLGFGFDGDGDRLAVVDSGGNIIYPDRLMMLYARDILSRNPGSKIVYDVKCSSRLGVIISKLGGIPIMWKTGHSYLKSKLREEKAELAGDLSGHIFFQERWYGFDDGMYAAARLLEILMGMKQPPADILAKLPTGVCTPELRVEFPEGEHLAFMQQFTGSAVFAGAEISTIDGIRADFVDGWGLVRASNTTPALTLRFEAHNSEALARIQAEFKTSIHAVNPDLVLPF